MAGWGLERGWQGRWGVWIQGWPRRNAAWKQAQLDRCCVWEESWYVGVLVCEDVRLGGVLKQKGLIFFSFEMAFLMSWSIKQNVTKAGGKNKMAKKQH